MTQGDHLDGADILQIQLCGLVAMWVCRPKKFHVTLAMTYDVDRLILMSPMQWSTGELLPHFQRSSVFVQQNLWFKLN